MRKMHGQTTVKFPHYLTKNTTFGINVCFYFLYNFCLQKFLILRRIQQGIAINLHWSSSSVRVILVRLQ